MLLLKCMIMFCCFIPVITFLHGISLLSVQDPTVRIILKHVPPFLFLLGIHFHHRTVTIANNKKYLSFQSIPDPWRNGSASDSRSEGCVFDSRRVQNP